MAATHYDTVIIGGGIIGLFTAWELATAGHSVCVIERGDMGGEASWAAGGILSPLRPWTYPEPVNTLALWSQGRYESICDQLQAHSGVDSEWHNCGMLVLDCPEHASAVDWAGRHSVRIETLTTSNLCKAFPELAGTNPAASGPACWLPDVAQLRNPRILQALVVSLRALGVELRERTTARSLEITRGKVSAVVCEDSVVRGEQVVVAAGAWTSSLLPWEGRQQAIRPVKGQMILYKSGAACLKCIVLKGGRYLVPRSDGRLLVGSTVEETGFDQATDEAIAQDLSLFAASFLPGLRDIPIEKHWAGLRPATVDEIPVIGRMPQVEGLYVNAGQFRSGIVTAPASARLLADLILGQTPIIDPGPFQA